MSTPNLLADPEYAETVRRWLVTPETARAWVVWSTVWMISLFCVSLLVGVLVGQPRNGIAVGIGLGGLCLVFTLERLWSTLDGVE